ncbi:MAG: Cell surface protein, partial [Chthonomonadaceae bacterium]|nr:Cell surface protein [Chthonomonadaceae bacterium]
MLFARSTAGTTVVVIALLLGREVHVTAQALPTRPLSSARSSARTPVGTKPLSHRKNVPLPMAFEASAGRTNRQDDFLAHGPGYRLALSPGKATFQLAGISTQSRPAAKHPAAVSRRDSDLYETLAMRLVGADTSAHAVQDAVPTGHANYFLGRDRSQWHTDIPLYDRVEYCQVYKGIDLVYYGNQNQLEYDFLVRPGTDPKRIALKFTGARRVRIAANGDLVLGLKQREVRWHKPLTYQIIAGKKRMVASSFVLKKGGKVGFSLARYDTSRPLTIDPKLIYSKTLGKGGVFPNSLVVDSGGNTYVAGSLSDTDFPVTPGAFQTSRHGAFVAKLNPAGTAFVYATYLGGSGLPAIGSDIATGIALDSHGNAYVTGTTASLDFPITPGAFQTTNRESTEYVDLGHNANSFVTKLNAAGSALIYSTYLGGHTGPGGADATNGIVVDSQGSAYVTGSATSADFPTTPGAYQPKRRSTQFFPGTGFVTKLNPAGTALIYSTFLEGSQGSGCYGIALGRGGEVYVTGGTNSADFPVTPKAFQKTNRKPASPDGNFDSTAFVTRLNSTGSALLYSTFLGGSGKYGDAAYGIAVDPVGSAYVVGTTFSIDFPTTSGAFQQSAPVSEFGVGGAFVTKLAPDASSLLYSTYLGDGDGNAISIDNAGNACIVGDVFGTGFPATVGAFPRPLNPTGIYATIAKLNSTGTALLYSTYLTDREVASSIALDNRGNATLCGPGFVERLSTNPVFPDFNNDGSTDLLLRNHNTGVIGTWFLNGADVVGGVTFSQIPPATYNLVG